MYVVVEHDFIDLIIRFFVVSESCHICLQSSKSFHLMLKVYEISFRVRNQLSLTVSCM